ncbi:MAG: 2-polyprenylphenol 6-hydroxylase [Parvularculaceae bacterium]|nr:2-polyprenylphenol 6-hydroxylase [Parvularculaceae bacterium]
MSPAYIKLGQLIATRPDIIGIEVARDLSRLHDKMPPFSQAEAQREVEHAFSKSVDDIFSEFSKPVAAASVAQVHAATLKSGERIAVKILRPRIEQEVRAEFQAFCRFARLIERVIPSSTRLEPVKFFETLSATASMELDLRLEAAAASAFAEQINQYDGVSAPKIYWPLTSRRVLAMEWVTARPLMAEQFVERTPSFRKTLARRLIQFFLTQALQHGFFHADMHPGNLLVDDMGHITFVDFGIMGRIDEKTRITFAEIIHGFITRDYYRAAQAHFDAGYVPKSHSIDAFAQALRAVGEPLFGLSAHHVDMSIVLQQLFDVTALFDMRLRPELVLLQRTMVVVEGVARDLDPEINMWEVAAPIVRNSIIEAIGPQRQARRLQAAVAKTFDLVPRLPEVLERLINEQAAAPRRDDLYRRELQQLIDAQNRTNRLVWVIIILGVATAAFLVLG